MATDAAETEMESWIAGIENEESIQGMYSIPPGTEQHPSPPEPNNTPLNP